MTPKAPKRPADTSDSPPSKKQKIEGFQPKTPKADTPKLPSEDILDRSNEYTDEIRGSALYHHFKTNELKELCKARSLPVSHPKPRLILSLLNWVPVATGSDDAHAPGAVTQDEFMHGAGSDRDSNDGSDAAVGMEIAENGDSVSNEEKSSPTPKLNTKKDAAKVLSKIHQTTAKKNMEKLKNSLPPEAVDYFNAYKNTPEDEVRKTLAVIAGKLSTLDRRNALVMGLETNPPYTAAQTVERLEILYTLRENELAHLRRDNSEAQARIETLTAQILEMQCEIAARDEQQKPNSKGSGKAKTSSNGSVKFEESATSLRNNSEQGKPEADSLPSPKMIGIVHDSINEPNAQSDAQDQASNPPSPKTIDPSQVNGEVKTIEDHTSHYQATKITSFAPVNGLYAPHDALEKPAEPPQNTLVAEPTPPGSPKAPAPESTIEVAELSANEVNEIKDSQNSVGNNDDDNEDDDVEL